MNEGLEKINNFATAIFALAKQAENENTDAICQLVNEIQTIVFKLEEDA